MGAALDTFGILLGNLVNPNCWEQKNIPRFWTIFKDEPLIRLSVYIILISTLKKKFMDNNLVQPKMYRN